MRIDIIGMGEVGQNVYDAIFKKSKFIDNECEHTLIGTDIKKVRCWVLSQLGYRTSITIDYKSDVYIIAVYLTEQVFDVLDKIERLHDTDKKPLVSIESTLDPHAVKGLEKYKDKLDVVLFPHRYNPDDPEHHVFNLDRIMGGFSLSAVNRAVEFFGKFMDKTLIHIVTPEIANLSKPMENAYRFMEIAIAQQMKISCDKWGVDFKELQKAMNTKWNINVLEPMQGIGGKCLPKDMGLISDYFAFNEFWDQMFYSNEKYKRYINKNENE